MLVSGLIIWTRKQCREMQDGLGDISVGHSPLLEQVRKGVNNKIHTIK